MLNKILRFMGCMDEQAIFIPENDHGVKPGYYRDIYALMQRHRNNSGAVQFITDVAKDD